jgi:hypothetical protein
MPQVDKAHYGFESYLDLRRLSSIWVQLKVLHSLQVDSILEVGPGNGLMKTIGKLYGFNISTFDFDPELKPDYVGSATELLFADDSFDVVCAFQMLEHLPFEQSLFAFSRMSQVARENVLISLPNCSRAWSLNGSIPIFGRISWLISNPFYRKRSAKFDGEHYWEIGKKDFDLSNVISSFEAASEMTFQREFRNPYNPYHHFILFGKSKK